MRTPIHRRGRLGSVPVLAVVALLLMSSDRAQAAGDVEDEGFFQAVIDGRKISREAFERAQQIDRADALEESKRREREVADRRTGGDGPSSDRAAGGGPENTVDVEPDPFPWTYVLLGGIAVGALIFIRLRRT